MTSKEAPPKSWSTVSLGEVCEFEYGRSLTKGARVETGPFPVFGSNGVVGHHSEFLVAEPSVIVGRKGAAGEVHISNGPFWPIDTTYFIRQKPGINLTFLYYQLKALRLSTLETSTAIPGLNRNDAYRTKIVIAPGQEQERIVAKIEELFSELDAGVEGLKKARAQLQTYRQSVLKHAFEGRLTNDNIKDGELPEGWKWVRSGDLFAFVTSGARGWAKHYSENGAVFLRITNLDFDTLDLDLKPEKIQRVAVPNTVEAERIKVKKGDYLFSITGYLGMFAIVPDMEDAYINQLISLARPKEGFNRKFVAYWVIAESGGIHHLNRARKGAVKAGLGLDDIKGFPVPICSLDEQRRIVAEIESRLSVCDKMEEAIEAGLKQAEALRQSILKKAFDGELVQQDESDEPVSLLLEKIRTEREGLRVKEKKHGSQTRQQRRIGKMVEAVKTILELLAENDGRPMSTRSVWQASKHKEDIDAFYAEVKALVDMKKIKETNREGRESFLILAKSR